MKVKQHPNRSWYFLADWLPDVGSLTLGPPTWSSAAKNLFKASSLKWGCFPPKDTFLVGFDPLRPFLLSKDVEPSTSPSFFAGGRGTEHPQAEGQLVREPIAWVEGAGSGASITEDPRAPGTHQRKSGAWTEGMKRKGGEVGDPVKIPKRWGEWCVFRMFWSKGLAKGPEFGHWILVPWNPENIFYCEVILAWAKWGVGLWYDRYPNRNANRVVHELSSLGGFLLGMELGGQFSMEKKSRAFKSSRPWKKHPAD